LARVVLIVGDTGTGKSTSIKYLNPKETAIINVLGKDLPFKDSNKMYNDENKNIKSVSNWKDIVGALQGIATKKEIKNVIIDDIGFSMTAEFFERAAEKGWDKFGEMGAHMQKIIVTAQMLPSDMNVAFMFHDEVINDDKSVYNKRNLKLIGRVLEDKYNPLAIVSVCLFTEVEFDAKGVASYGFITQRSLDKNGIIVPAKSPDGMFEERKIPNNLQLVFDTMNSFFG